MQRLTLPTYLAFKEILRNKGRFLLVGMVIALITVLVLFIAGLGEGLGNGNREYLAKLDADLLVFQSRSEFLIPSSRLPHERLNAIRRVAGVADAGPIATSSATLLLPDGVKSLRLGLLGVEPDHAGQPPVFDGRGFSTDLANEVIIDRSAAIRSGYKVGDRITIRVTQGTRDEFYQLLVVGISDGQQYSLQPTLFVPYSTWDRVRPKSEAELLRSNPVYNVIAVRLADGADLETVRQTIEREVDSVQAVTIGYAITQVPGYSAQQSTIQTQGVFTLLIGVLVIGGFFQIQILQKVAQIGVLKAIGTPNPLVAAASVIQIVMITALGVGLGGLGTFLLALGFPPTVPIVFNGQSTLIAVLALLLIGPIGGLVSVRYAVKIEPLKALGLG